MKAKQLKNGTYTISGVTPETIEAVAKMLDFAHKQEMGYGYHVEETRKKCDELRADGDVITLANNLRFFFQCITDMRNRK